MTHAEIIADLADLRRRIANLQHFGTITEADYTAARVRVTIGAILTEWLPWLTARAGDDTVWHAPEIGEQVIVLSPSGDIGNGVVIPAIYSDAKPANATAATIHRTTYADGTVIEYDREAHKLTTTVKGSVEIIAAGAVKIKGASITLDAPSVTATGELQDANGTHGTLSAFRSVYNSHTNPNNGGSPPPQKAG